jgi:hypothetical protein
MSGLRAATEGLAAMLRAARRRFRDLTSRDYGARAGPICGACTGLATP